MKEKVKHIASQLHPRRIPSLLHTFLVDESISGKLILLAATVSLAIVNSPLKEAYNDFWHVPLSLGIGGWNLSLDLRHWLNEGLMAFFFLLVGIEIKREVVRGELREFKNAILPVGAAVGGMVVPALIYALLNSHTEAYRGWGIPIATDIAFAVAVLSLLGNRVPASLKVFLLTLAIADDIGALLVIALFYAEIIHYGYLFASVAIICSIFLSRKWLTDKLLIVIGSGILLWFTTYQSGVHASIIGAIMGLLAPVATPGRRVSVAEKIEKLLLPVTTFVVLPLFAFANAGFALSTHAVTQHWSVVGGIFGGLVVGKALGITVATWLLTRAKVATLPKGIHWHHIGGVGFVAGIGFTVSIFITELAFHESPGLIDAAKASIFIASAASGLLGLLLLRSKRHT